MMAGNPNYWWSMNPPSSLIPPQYVLGSSSSSSSAPFNNSLNEIPEPPPQSSWSQLLFTGLPGEEERLGFNHFQQNPSSSPPRVPNNFVDVMLKQEVPQSGNNINLYGQFGNEEEFQASWSSSSHNMVPPVSNSPRSSVTSNNNSLLDFTYHKAEHHRKNQLPYGTTESNSTTTDGVCKKAKGQPSSNQPPLKVRKEKLGDRITALHQLVSPFGKTDTASVLLEAIGYIRFLQTQIEALSSPYLGNGSKNMRNQHYVHHGERNSVFPEDPGQLLNDSGLKRKAAPSQECGKDKAKDLRSRGLCLVPVSCTQHIGNENGADYWSPAYGSGF